MLEWSELPLALDPYALTMIDYPPCAFSSGNVFGADKCVSPMTSMVAISCPSLPFLSPPLRAHTQHTWSGHAHIAVLLGLARAYNLIPQPAFCSPNRHTHLRTRA